MQKKLPIYIQNPSRTSKLLVAGLIVAVSVVTNVLIPSMANAATFSQTYVRFDRMKASTATTGLVCARPGTSSSDVKTWEVVFPTGFTVTDGGSGANWSSTNISTSNIPAGTSAWPNATSATASATGQTVTWTNGSPQTMSTGTTYCYRWTASSALTTSSANPNLQGTVTTKNSSAVVIDSSTYATAVITDDEIDVTATVPATFSFSITSCTSNQDALGNLSTSSATSSSSPCHVLIGTNATNGYYAWVKDVNQGLTSTSASDTINTSGTVDGACSSAYSSGTEFYGLDADETADPQTNGTVDAEYNCSATTVGAYGANYATLATGTGPTSGYEMTLNNRAAASTTNKAATDYTDTVTVVGAGNF